jgi:hypothetical protein
LYYLSPSVYNITIHNCIFLLQYTKPEDASAVLGSWWWAVCRAKHVELHIKFWYTVASYWIFFVNCTTMHGSTNIRLTSTWFEQAYRSSLGGTTLHIQQLVYVVLSTLNIWSEHNYIFSHRLVHTATCFGPVYWPSPGCIINLISSYTISAWCTLGVPCHPLL